MKTCSRCGEEKELSLFKFNSKGNPGWCLICTSDYSRDYMRSYNRAEQQREHHLRATYGIGVEEFNRLLQAQNYCCLICGRENDLEDEYFKQFAVDHCHDSGRIRGLLCRKCNSGLGFFNDDPTILQRAIEYLKDNQDG